MAGADEAKGTSMLTDWEGTVDAAIRIHECIYRRLEDLQGAWAGLGTDRGGAERTTRSKTRDGAQLAVLSGNVRAMSIGEETDDEAPTRRNVGRRHNRHEYVAAFTRTD